METPITIKITKNQHMGKPEPQVQIKEENDEEEEEGFVVIGVVGNEEIEKGDDPKSDTFLFMDSLPDEMLQEIFKFLSLYDIINVELVSKRWRRIARNFEKQKRILWKWSAQNKSENIELLEPNRTNCSRPASKGHNPAVLAEQPLTKEFNHFRVEVLRLGKWIGIGIADTQFQLEGASTLGSQTNSANSSYFWQNSGIRRIQMFGIPHEQVTPISAGNVIDVLVDFDLQKIYYWNDMKFVGELESTKIKLEEGTIYPCANLSQDTEVAFRNHDKVFPLAEDDRLTKTAMTLYVPWSWSTNIQRKSPIIETEFVADKLLIAFRPAENPHGVNPAVMTSIPFTKTNLIFQIHIVKLGSWIAVGFTDTHLQLNGDKPLGSQTHCFNSAYFWREDGVSRLLMHGESCKSAGCVAPGVTVTIKMDFGQNRVDYYLDNVHQGYLTSKKYKMQFGTLFPCVSLSKGTEVQIENDLTLFKKKETKPQSKLMVTIKKLFK